MSNRAWMPLHIADYLADTGHLTAAEHGAYLLMIMHYWQNGNLPENERLIARIAKLSAEQWEESRDILAMLFGPGWSHKRIDAELSKADEIIEKRRAAASVRHWKGKTEANAEHVQSMCSDTRVPPLTDNLSTSSLRSDVCPETEKSAPAPQSPSVIDLPATQGMVVSITEADVAEWRDAFPAVDVPQQLRAMRQWLLANERNRKTVRGMRKFVVSWLARDQDRGGACRHNGHQSQAPPRKSAFQQHQDDCQREIDRVLGQKPDDEFTGNTLDLAARDYRAH